jgi:hypothetical protein
VRVSTPQQRDALVGEAVDRFGELEAKLDEMERIGAAAPADTHHAAPPARHVLVHDAQPSHARDRDATDVVNHLHAWHVLLIGWLDADAAGARPAYPAEGYTWGELHTLNRDLRDRYRGDGVLAPARERLRASHAEALGRAVALSDSVLFETECEWARGTLAEPIHECLGGHYQWALDALENLRRG